MLIWSEPRGARTREVLADVTTFVWVALWLYLGARLYSALAELAASGRLIRDGGENLRAAGTRMGEALEEIPLVGEGAAGGVRGTIAGAAAPMIEFGTNLERLLLIVAALLGLMVVALALTPWLNRYLPWRIARWRRLNAAARVIRRGTGRSDHVSQEDVEAVLASRALYRLEYDELLAYSPDPLGDWYARRHSRLARAELDRVGLAPR
ncbi:MAG TPA: hypothetical protein VHK06_07500 [Candidatus Limnocylindria bacterium]|nr:hypothetical protein [Candidatus Limnocylindria bacterium]